MTTRDEHKRELIAATADRHREDAAVDAPECIMRITWRAIGRGPAHAQPADDGHRRHFCQGMKARSMSDPAGTEPPLRTPRELRALFRIEHAKDAPVCAGCVSVLHWLFGDAALEVVTQYRAKGPKLLGQIGQQPAIETKNVDSPNRAKNRKAE